MRNARDFLPSSDLTPSLIAAIGLCSLAVALFAGCGGEADAPLISLGPRPAYLISQMADGPLRRELEGCANKPATRTDFSIGHRGAPLLFPEHTRASYEAAARMGAGILECDVTFTKDRELVCRHAQCDLHQTTNILLIPELAQKCSEPFVPADPATGAMASARCCTSDITLKEFKRLCGKMDGANPNARTPAEYVAGTAGWRTDLYATCGEVLSHAESIELFRELGVKYTPELKEPLVPMPYEGVYTRQAYAQQLVDEYRDAGVDPSLVFPQSFHLEDIAYWLGAAPEFGRNAVYLDDEVYPENMGDKAATARLADLAAQGVRTVAPPMWALLTLDASRGIVPSAYAEAATQAGLDIITWTLERSGPLTDGGGWYFQSVSDAIKGDGDAMVVLDVLASQVGIVGIFSDWPATSTYFANCHGLVGR